MLRKFTRKMIFPMLIMGLLMGSLLTMGNALAAASPQTVDIMFLHDTHSHLNEFATVENGESQMLGGFAKIKTLINQQKEHQNLKQLPITLLHISAH